MRRFLRRLSLISLIFVVFTVLWTQIAVAQININVKNPWKDDLLLDGSSIHLVVAIESEYEVASVTASLDGVEYQLVFVEGSYCASGRCPGYVGDIPLEASQQGRKVIEITAKDVFNNMAVATRSFIYDALPIVRFTLPVAEQVADPTLPLRVSCSDSRTSDCSITVKVSPDTTGRDYPYCPSYREKTIFRGGSQINTIINLSQYAGQSVTLCVVARDSSNQWVYETKVVHVKASSVLQPVLTTTGRVVDMSENMVLSFSDYSNYNRFWEKLVLLDRQTGVNTNISMPTSRGAIFPHAGIVDGGVFFITKYSVNQQHSTLYYWQHGEIVEIGGTNLDKSISFNKGFVIWIEKDGAFYVLKRFDFATKQKHIIDQNTGRQFNGVGPNGDVVYWKSNRCILTDDGNNFEVYLYRDNVSQKLTQDSSVHNLHPLTDGLSVIYTKFNTDTKYFAIAMHKDGEESLLSEYKLMKVFPKSGYQINSGWIAYLKAGGNGKAQIWMRSPAGVEKKLTFFGSDSWLEYLGSDGNLTFINRDKRYLVSFDGRPVEVSSRIGRAISLNNQLYVAIGNTIYSMVR